MIPKSGKRDVLAAATAALVALAGCSMRPTPVPVRGAPENISRLVGEWAGRYDSDQTGRSGTISFSLQAHRDTATGSVVMLPARGDAAGEDEGFAPGTGVPPRGELLTIRFVMTRGRTVTGELDPYTDPRCGCRLDTRFIGTLVADTIQGTFTSRHVDTGTLVRGRWRVVRRTH